MMDVEQKDKSEKEKPAHVIIRNTADYQRMKLEKLMKNPEKPVLIPERPKERGSPHIPDFVRNVMGSSAGAGSGEFHVYRHLRRKEYARQKYMQEKAERERKDTEYQGKLEENKRLAEQRTAKKRAKRLKKKKNRKDKPKKPKLEESSESESCEENSDEGDTADIEGSNHEQVLPNADQNKEKKNERIEVNIEENPSEGGKSAAGGNGKDSIIQDTSESEEDN